nr:reverse transcriptase domain-containing protein [Tanacetum cinerariifolium]
MPLKRTSTSEATAMTQAAIKKFIADTVTADLEAQAATMANTSNPNRKTGPTGTPVAKMGNYKEFISCQPFYFNDTKGAVGLIRWRFQELAVLCPNMVSDTEKLLEAFIEEELSTTTTTAATITTTITPIPTTATITTNHSKTKDKKLSKLMLPHQLKTIDAFYDIKMADGNLVSTNTIIKGATLTLLNQPFEIDLMPIKLGSFNVVIGMDWLSKYHAKILCDEKVVHIPVNDETLIIRDLVIDVIFLVKKLEDNRSKRLKNTDLDFYEYNRYRPCTDLEASCGNRSSFLQMMKGSDIGIQEKKAKLFNEWERQMQMVKGNGGNQFRQYAGQNARNSAGYNDVIRNQQASTSSTQTDSAPVYDSDGSAKVHENCDENCDDNEIFNMFTQEEQYTELLEPILESHQVPQNDNDVIPEDTSVEQATEVEKVNSINRKLKETNADLTTELARFKNQTRTKNSFRLSKSFLSQASSEKQQSLYDGNVLLEKHDPPVVHDSEETLQLAQESRDKMKQMNKEIKPANYTKINHLSGVFVPQTALSREELYFSNNSKTATVSKSISIPNEDFSDDATISVAHKFLNEVKSTIVTLRRVVKQRMTIETHNWSSSGHQELHKIEAAKFVGDFKSLANEADASLAKHKSLELEIERLLKAVVSQDIMIIMQNESIVDTSDLQTELECMKERFENCIIKKKYEYAKLWNDWYKKCDECKYDKISYDKAYKDMQQKIERLQAQLGDLKGVDNTKTRRPQPRSNTKHDRVPSASKSSQSKNKEAKVEEHHRNLLLSKNNKHISSACNNIKIDSQDVISKVVCAKCKKCLISVNHDECLHNYVNGKNSHGKKQKAEISFKENQMKYQLKVVTKPKKVESHESLATPKPRKSRLLLRWSPTGRLFDHKGKIVDSSASVSQSDCVNGDNACTSNSLKPKIKWFPNSTSLLD